MVTHITEEFAVTAQPVLPRQARFWKYYLVCALITLMGISYGYLFSEIFFPGDKAPWIETLMGILKLSWLVPLPYALINFYAFLRFPVFEKPDTPAVVRRLGIRVYVRIVTRGQNPKLIAASVKSARRGLSAVFDPAEWIIEVVSDNPLDLGDPDDRIRLIHVPPDYHTATSAKYKARALQYALETSGAADDDWIIHLDEETSFDADTMRAVQRFIYQQRRLVALKQQVYPKIGQGVIVYGKGQITNWFTTLADSIRVADDYGRFRFQYANGKAWFGMHGSFIVINRAVEAMIGFDHGTAGSITEDSYFALLAQAAGIRFEFINARMYEKSPFTVSDFIKQRRRWFGGIWVCVLTGSIALKDRAILALFMLMWSLSWLCPVIVVANFIYPTGTPAWLGILGGLAFVYTVWMYVVGFLLTFDRQRPKQRYIPLLIAQIIGVPLFSIMESAAVIWGLLSPPKDFYIVQKEPH